MNDLDFLGLVKSLGQAWLLIGKLEARVTEQDKTIEELKKESKKGGKRDAN